MSEVSALMRRHSLNVFVVVQDEALGERAPVVPFRCGATKRVGRESVGGP